MRRQSLQSRLMNMTSQPHPITPPLAGSVADTPTAAAEAWNTDFVTTSSAPSGTSHIRSFVHRRAHITPGQKEALDRLLPLWSLPYRNGLLDFDTVFGRQAPTVLEIGFGMGETTQKIAQARPGEERKSVVEGKGVSVRVEAGGGQYIKKN